MRRTSRLSQLCRTVAGQVALVLVVVWSPIMAAPSQPADTARELPSFAAIKTIVESTLGQDRNYRPGDVLSQGRVASVFAALKVAGWDVPQSRELLALVPTDNDFLVRALSTKKGVAFMRKVAPLSGGYDRVDRLSRIPNGQPLVEKLINGPDGHKLIGYFIDSRGGKELGQMLGQTSHDPDFNRPTGRIYTATQLLAALEKLHVAASRQ